MSLKETIGILLVIGLVITLVFIILYLFRSEYTKIKHMFNNTDNNIPVGGILMHMTVPEDFENIVKKDSIELLSMTDCASINRHTCSAWTYLRKDLPPMIFSLPSAEIPICGIIIDPRKAWSLLTTMGVIDAATDYRSCLTNEEGMNQITAKEGDNSCVSNLLIKKYPEYSGWTSYVPLKDIGGQCPLNCADDDDFCKYRNAGGGIDYNNFVTLPACFDGNYDDCFKFTEIDSSKVPKDILNLSPNARGYLVQSITPQCTQASKPFLCVTKNPPNDESKLNSVEEANQYSAYINPDGSNWVNIFMPNDSNKLSVINTMTTQCKFEKYDWNAWVNTLKNYYNTTLKGLKPDNSYIDSTNNWQIANPEAPWTYLENEVNMYVNPDTSSSEYKQQNNVFIDSIVGFFYVDSLCEDQLKPLNGITTQYGNGTIYSNAADRCDAYYEMPEGDRPIVEKQRREQSKNAVINIVKWFNKKYNKNTVGFSANPDSNSFANYDSWKKSLTGDEQSFDDIFKKIS